MPKMQSEQRESYAEIPREESPAEISEPTEVATGLAAIYATVQHGLREMGAARTLKTLTQINQKGGFDCPSCAWPDPDDKRSVAEFCENGAKAVASEATHKRVTPEFFSRHSVADLAAESDYWLNEQGRITHPMLLKNGATNYEAVTWDEAFNLIADELNALASPDEAVFYTSGRTSNEAAFLYQLFVRQFGTNNLPDCSNMCHESTSFALAEVIGIGKATVKLEDFEKSQAIFLFGHNPGTNHPRMLTYLQEAKQNGCTIVSVNPLPETGLMYFRHPQHPLDFVKPATKISDLFLPVKIAGDIAVLKGMMKEVLAAEAANPSKVLDYEFIRDKTSGFEEFRAALDEVSWDDITDASGLTREQIRQAADVFIKSERTIICWCMGMTQHKHGVANVQEIANLMLMRGQIGKPGAGLCPVRGHSNVQGDRTMGIWEKMPDKFLDKLGAEFNFEPPHKHGYDTVKAIKAMHAGQAKIFFGLGGNFLSATPDTEFTAKALTNCRLTVQVSTKLNRAHLVTGEQALILPCLGRTESDVQAGGKQFVTVENTTGVVHQSHGTLLPASDELLSEPAIIARLATATLKERSTVNWMDLVADYDRIRDRIAHVVDGCDDYNQKVRAPGGFYLPNGARERDFTKTKTQRAQFSVVELPHIQLADDQLLMLTMRSHDQFNTTIYGLNDRYRGISNGRRVIFLNAEDLQARGLKPGDWVNITSHFNGDTRTIKQFMCVAYNLPRDCAATYFPESNPLVHIDHTADKSNQPASKSIVITIEPTTAPVGT